MDNNEQLQRTKILVTKTLAVIGFFATIVLLVWALVQVAQSIPSAFTSLASLAESIYKYQPNPELKVTPQKNIVNSGESFKIAWNDLGQNGTYTFSYPCTDGVSVDIESLDSGAVKMDCGGKLSLPETVTSLTLAIRAEQKRFTDVPFTVRFGNTDGSLSLEKSTEVTVVNATIPQASSTLTEETGSQNTASVIGSTEENGSTETETATPEAKPVPTQPTQTVKTISYMPVSYPNGFTDLKVSYLGIGVMDGDTFVPKGTFTAGERGAIRFEIKNIGTKTSGNWTFSATLPSGMVYNSDTQAPLKPNEHAIFTLGFNAPDTAGDSNIAVSLDSTDDTNSTNDAFTWFVKTTE